MTAKVWYPAPGVLEVLGAILGGIRNLAERCLQTADKVTVERAE